MNEDHTEVSKYHPIVTPSLRYSSMQCSARISPTQIQALIISKLIKKRRYSLGAQEGAKVGLLVVEFYRLEPSMASSCIKASSTF